MIKIKMALLVLLSLHKYAISKGAASSMYMRVLAQCTPPVFGSSGLEGNQKINERNFVPLNRTRTHTRSQSNDHCTRTLYTVT